MTQRFDDVRRFLPAAAGLALALCAACSDDGGGDDVDAAADPADAGRGVDAADAAPQVEDTISGLVSIRDVTVTNPEAGESHRGAEIEVEFLDLEETSYLDQVGDSPVGGCVVRTYGGDDEPVYVGEGEVTLSGTGAGDADGGFACGPGAEAGGYECVLAEGDDTDMTLVYDATGDTNAVRLSLADTDLSDSSVTGGYISATGFGDEALDGVAFPIAGQQFDEQSGATALLLRPADFAGDEDATAEGGSFRVVYGAENGAFAGNEGAFVPGSEAGETTISVAKEDGSVVEAFDVDADPLGDGMVLATGEKNGTPYIQPHAFPLPADGQDAVDGGALLGCGEDLGDPDAEPSCGIIPEDPAGNLSAFIIAGRTTDADLEGAGPFEMPAPESAWAEFRCVFVGRGEGRLTEDAINAVLATEPTRIRMGAMHASRQTVAGDDGANAVTVHVGHELVGYTDVNSAAE